MSQIISIPIIPSDQTFINVHSNKIVSWSNSSNYSLDYKSLAIFSSLGFMLDDETHFKELKVCKPGWDYELDDKQNIIQKYKRWNWYYEPKYNQFNDVLNDFSMIINEFVSKQTYNKSVLLPISSGLDSRSLFVPISNKNAITLASYEFEGGFNESFAGEMISKLYNIPFYKNKIQSGYLWNKIEELYRLNNCFTDFTHPRQVDVIQFWKSLGEVILLGHWGDVLFDRQASDKCISHDEQIVKLKHSITKSSGLELAKDLWEAWSLESTFESFLEDRLSILYKQINIDEPSSKMRAFKSLYWAPRWTSINLSFFKSMGEIVLPYYSEEICNFICDVPEDFLAGRKIQIEYIKKYCPNIALIPWQQYYPCNLNNYSKFNNTYYLFLRSINKAKQIVAEYVSKTKPIVERNWEIQFLGENNFDQLYNMLEDIQIIPKTITKKYLDNFLLNPIKYAHSVSVLLTLSFFSKKYYNK